ncbi:MAG: sugar phosphate isomerase/epimerase [Lentisphaerae bacterium]|jgi:sugar phosphate isomerase/epimerase|nr:sugar phosphate isomerase/epimerase [Lentisphaerota bacterium]MBT5608383.1 sugar phosphate isomerase/epimerase [Lentisphaerota bacterium]MBT7061000.1 sugar phosphate isomerase/epimerase [Lentisphaerota bacterium]MBT7848367.1 sugar phosphate isomerase/epimerase [Lentisphaerota bacterium]
MKIGASTYSLSKAIKAGAFDLLGTFDWLAENGADHIEIVPLRDVFSFAETPGLVATMAAKAQDVGLEISCYTLGASFINRTAAEFSAELDRVKEEIDNAAGLGTALVRHDVAFRPAAQATDEQFEKDLPLFVDACGQLADYAAHHGITTMIENHGFHVQGAARVLRIYNAVGRDNFRLLVDTGNFFPVEFDNTLSAIKQCSPFAGMVHTKDHHIRSAPGEPVDAWRDRGHGVFTQAAIAAEGDIGVAQAIGFLRDAGYDGYLSLEYEGPLDACEANRRGMENLREILG